jgi:hypothetical protein
MSRFVQRTHSAKVRLRLQVNGDDLEVAQVGDGLCVLRDPRPHPPGDAQLIITIDGHTETHPVFLCHGIAADSREVTFV